MLPNPKTKVVVVVEVAVVEEVAAVPILLTKKSEPENRLTQQPHPTSFVELDLGIKADRARHPGRVPRTQPPGHTQGGHERQLSKSWRILGTCTHLATLGPSQSIKGREGRM